MKRNRKGQFTSEELSELRMLYQPKCKVSCDEYHAHSALDGCLSNENENAVTICQLLEHIQVLEERVEKAFNILEGGGDR
jgi:hypothetical protein